MSKDMKEEVMRVFATLPKELQKGIVIGLAAGMAVDNGKQQDDEKKGE